MMRRILLPLERCDDDAGAVAFAGLLARRRRMEALLLRVEEWPLFGPFTLGWVPAWRSGDLEKVKTRLDAVDGLRTRIVLPVAVPSTKVLEQARLRSASLILLPYRQDRPLMRVMYGRPGDRMLRESPIPVLAVPGSARPISRILYLFDGGETAVSGLRHVVDFAQLFEADVALLRVPLPSPLVPQNPPVEERLLSILGRREVSAHVATGPGDPVEVAAREGADLVVLPKTHETGKACTALARRLLLQAAVPLLLTSEGPVPSPFTGAEAPVRVGI